MKISFKQFNIGLSGNSASEYLIPGAFMTISCLAAVTLLNPQLISWVQGSSGGRVQNQVMTVQSLGSNVHYPVPQVLGTSGDPIDPGGTIPANWVEACFSTDACISVPPTPQITTGGLGSGQIGYFATALNSISTLLGSQLPANDPLMQALRNAASQGSTIGNNFEQIAPQVAEVNWASQYPGSCPPGRCLNVIDPNNNNVGALYESNWTQLSQLGSSQTQINQLLGSQQYAGLVANYPWLSNTVNSLINLITYQTNAFGMVSPNFVGPVISPITNNTGTSNSTSVYANSNGLSQLGGAIWTPPATSGTMGSTSGGRIIRLGS
ncbi:MAG: hypothetical protein K2X01_02265 [Cyanobacteria bacterium]|nr:hypothetical protein [Cyanobacteriota bacterium]